MKPLRRIVTVDDDEGQSVAIADGVPPDVQHDPARPGFSSARIWVTASSPAQIGPYRDAVHSFPRALTPPRGGSMCRIVTFPPDDTFRGKVGAAEVAAYFRAAGSPAASTFSRGAPHPYMQHTPTLDFCLILDGEITLVLDTQEVHLKAGDTVVQRGTNHAWSNRSNRPCRIAFSSHDAAG
jgi:mannose-6-phosphate isomerase-like protein (cupin superfamily)